MSRTMKKRRRATSTEISQRRLRAFAAVRRLRSWFGKGDVAASMNLTMKDWATAGVLSGISDADMFDLIVKGKGKMIGEGDRLPPEKAWNMVHYVRSFAKKGSGVEKDAAAATPPKS